MREKMLGTTMSYGRLLLTAPLVLSNPHIRIREADRPSSASAALVKSSLLHLPCAVPCVGDITDVNARFTTSVVQSHAHACNVEKRRTF